MFQQIVEKVKANKATLIRAGAAVAGAVVGVMVAAALSGEPEDWMIEEPYEDEPELPEETE